MLLSSTLLSFQHPRKKLEACVNCQSTRLKNPPIYGDCTLVCNIQDHALPFLRWHCILNFRWLPMKNLRLFLPSKRVPIPYAQLALHYNEKCCNRDTAYRVWWVFFLQCFEIEVQHSVTKAYEL